MTKKAKKYDVLAVATGVMTALCFVAMLLPDLIGWFTGQGAYPFLSMLLLFAPILAFGWVAAYRRVKKRRNSLFFVKVAAVSQLIIALMVISLIKLLQFQDDYNDGFNWSAYIWAISALATIVIYLRERKSIQQDETEGLKVADHVWAVAPLALFVVMFFLNVIVTAKSLHLFFNNGQQEIVNGGVNSGY